MNAESDQDRLNRYCRQGDEAAFDGIVKRQVDWVYSAARRIVVDPHLAEDVTQAVFAALAREAALVVRRLEEGTPLSAWLHRTTRNIAAKMVRTEERRRTREQEFAIMPDTNASVAGEPAWEQIAPQLDAVIADLQEPDRHALLLRFFERQTAREIGARLGIGEEAAQKRVSRALERLRGALVSRGLPVSVVALSQAVEGQVVQTAPAGLAAAIGTALPVVSASGTASWIAAWLPSKAAAIASSVLAAGLAVTAVWQHREQGRLQAEIQELLSRAEVDPTATPAARAVPAGLVEAQQAELLRLRGEVARLLRERSEWRAKSAANADSGTAASASADPTLAEQEREAVRQVGIRKLNVAKAWALALHLYAAEHDDRFPDNLSAAAAYFSPPEGVAPADLDEFELVHGGALAEIANPAEALLIREKTPFPNFDRPGYSRTYGFMDGHSEIRRMDDDNFEAYEKAHAPILKRATGAGLVEVTGTPE